MKTKHTTGEWNAKDSEVYSLITGNTIARCDIGGKDETTEANAKLIAAAPELFSQVQQAKVILEAIDPENPAIKQMEKVLIKATSDCK